MNILTEVFSIDIIEFKLIWDTSLWLGYKASTWKPQFQIYSKPWSSLDQLITISSSNLANRSVVSIKLRKTNQRVDTSLLNKTIALHFKKGSDYDNCDSELLYCKII